MKNKYSLLLDLSVIFCLEYFMCYEVEEIEEYGFF